MMEFGLATYGFGLIAGLLSTLSPCVLPLIPILLGSAVSAHRRGPLFLGLGLVVSFATIGSTIAFLGASIGVEQSTLRNAGAIVLGLFGIILLSSTFQQKFSNLTSGIGSRANNLMSSLPANSLGGQFFLGLILGVVWSPCVGPTLGAAITVASQGQHFVQITTLMIVFGFGAALPFVLLGLLSRNKVTVIRGKLMLVGRVGKILMGISMLLLAAAILSDFDKQIEAWFVTHMPNWLILLSTRY